MKSIFDITCGDFQTHLIAFVHGDGTHMLRRRISRHLDHCANCYAQYRRELDLVQSLSRDVPLIGQTNQPNFDQLWGAIQTNIQMRKSYSPHFQMRYGLAMLAMVVVFLMPMTLSSRTMAFATPPTQPSPLLVRMTPDSTAPIITATTIALLADESQATPEASQQSAGPSVHDIDNTP